MNYYYVISLHSNVANFKHIPNYHIDENINDI